MFPFIIGLLLISIIVSKMKEIIVTKNNKKNLKLNTHYFPNPKIYEIIEKNIPQKYKNVKFEIFNMQVIDDDQIIVQIYVTDPQIHGWNVTQKLIEMTFKNDILVEIKDINSIDTGAIIPAISDKYLTNFAINRDWEDHKKNWDTYKKNWSVKWGNIPYLRTKIV